MPGVRIASTLALASVGVTLLLAGCGADPVPSAATPVPSSSGSSGSSVTPSVAPSAGAESGAPSEASSATSPGVPSAGAASSPGNAAGTRHKVDRFRLGLRPGARSAADAHLLDAAEMPSVAGAAWTLAERDGRPAGVGACQKTGMEPIGAMEEARRSFTAPGGLAATEVVARFADERSAWQAHRVLVAWHDDCEQRVSGASVGPLEPVGVPVGSSDGYRTSYAARPRTTGVAILRTGTWLTLVEVSSRADYPRRWDPARVALRRAARTF